MYQTTNIATVAAVITLLKAQLTAENARMIVWSGGPAASITGTLTFTIMAFSGVQASFTHRIYLSLNCPTLADASTLVDALSVFATAVETESAFTLVQEVGAIMNTIMTD